MISVQEWKVKGKSNQIKIYSFFFISINAKLLSRFHVWLKIIKKVVEGVIVVKSVFMDQSERESLMRLTLKSYLYLPDFINVPCSNNSFFGNIGLKLVIRPIF